MKYITFDESRPMDLALLGRVTIDFNPTDFYNTLEKNTTFKKYIGGSPANIAVGLARLGKKCGFISCVSDDQFGNFAIDTMKSEGIDTTYIMKAKAGEKLGLTFTEILSRTDSSILMYRDSIADLSLTEDMVNEDYIKKFKAILISGTALSKSPSREAALKAVQLSVKTNTPVFFDIDYREYSWRSREEMALYYHLVASEASLIIGSREEYDLTERLMRPGMDDTQSAEYWCSKKSKIVVIKHGKKGSTAYTCDDKSYTIKPFPIEKLKSFGGGDGYASSFIYGLFEGKEIIDCLELGSASASLLVASHGCGPFMPTIEKLNKYIADCKQEYGDMIARE